MEKKPVKIDFTNGLDVKSDQMLVVPGKLTGAVDVLFEGQTIVQRAPWSKAANTSGARRISTHDGLVVEEFGTTGGGHPPAAQVWGPRMAQPFSLAVQGWEFGTPNVAPDPTFSRYALEVQPLGLGRSPAQLMGAASAPDCAYGNGVSIWVWHAVAQVSGTLEVMGLVVDDTTGAIIDELQLRSAADQYAYPRVVYLASTNTFYVYFEYLTGGAPALQVVTRVANAYPTPFSGVVTVLTSAGDGFNGTFDVTVDEKFATDILLVQASTTAPNMRLYVLSKTDGSTRLLAVANNSAVVPTQLCAVISKSGSTVRYNVVYIYPALLQVMASGMTSGGVGIVEVMAGNVGVAHGGSTMRRVTAVAPDSTTPWFPIFVELFPNGVSSSTTAAESIICASRVSKDLSVVVGAPWEAFHGLNLHGQAIFADGEYLLPVRRSDPIAPTVFVADVSNQVLNSGGTQIPPHIIARIEYGRAGGVQVGKLNGVSSEPLPSSFVGLNGAINVMYTRWAGKTIVSGGTGTEDNPYVFARAQLYGPEAQVASLGHLEVQNGTLLAGGCPQWFDGARLVEAGWHFRPIITGVAGAFGGGHLPGDTFTAAATYSWVDALGNWHESAPSPMFTFSATAGQYVNLYVGLPLTRKPGARINLYRSRGVTTGDTTLYFNSAVPAVPNAYSGTSFVAGLKADGIETAGTADLLIAGNNPLPTTGNILPNDPPPSCRQMAIWQDRVWFAGCNDGYDLYFSQVIADGIFPECSIQLGERVQQNFGRVVGVGEMESKLAVFCENQIGVLYGTGPSNTGDQNNYSSLLLIAHEPTRWNSPKSIAHTPDGIWFLGALGLRCLQNDGSVSKGQDGRELGGAVDALVVGPVITCVRFAHREAWFVDLGSARIQAWNWEWRQWSSLRTRIGTSAGSLFDAANLGDFVFLGVSDTWMNGVGGITGALHVWYDDAASGLLDYGVYDMGSQCGVQFAPLQLAGLQGFQRLYRAQVLAEGAPADTLRFSVNVGYDFGNTVAEVSSSTPVGSGYPAVAQFEHLFSQQKCEALTLGFQFAGTTARARLTGLNLLVGVKGGVYKLPTGQRF